MKSPTKMPAVPVEQLVLQLKPAIHWNLQESGGRKYYLLEDTLQARFVRVGQREFQYVSLMDGMRSMAQISESVAATSSNPLSAGEVRTLCQWLLQHDLVQSPQLSPNSARSAAAHSGWQQLVASPLMLRIPLFRPDPLLARLFPWLRWSLTPSAAVVWVLVVAWAALSIFAQRAEFGRQLTSVLEPHNWLWLLVTWLGLKTVHELYHGLVCKLYGGTVSQAGIMFVLFSPVVFVDVTSSWKFRNKWQRIYTAAAGMYAEFFVAALASLAWCRLEDGSLRQLCHNIVTMASVATLLFNANFLMRFDGYYIFSDWLEFQNLYATARQSVINQLRRWFLGVASPALPLEPWRRWVVAAYGWASLAWRTLFTLGILIISARMFRGLGLVLTAITVISWFGLPLLRWWRRPRATDAPLRPNWLRGAAIAAGIAVLTFLAGQLPWPGGVRAPAAVEYAPLHLVRVESPGFVERVAVEAGQLVEPGDVLVELRNPETVQRLKDLELEIALSEARSRVLHREERMSEYLVENRRRQALQERLGQLQHEVARLTVRAEVSGRVLGRDLPTLLGQYVGMGHELMAVGDEHRKQLEASVGQADIPYFEAAVGGPAKIYVRGRAGAPFEGLLERLNPRASRQISHPALVVNAGGPLGVTVRHAASSEESSEPATQLTEARGLAIVTLPEPAARQLRAGQIAYVKLGGRSESISEHVARAVRTWVERKSAIGSARTGGL
jgi:putative peptide zinc metalloprotease protein